MKTSQRSASPGCDSRLGVDGHHDALRAEFVGGFLENSRRADRGGVDRDLVGAGAQQRADVLDGAHAAADGQRHEADLGGARTTSSMVPRPSWLAVMSRKHQLVGAGRVIGDGRFDRIAGVAQIDEIDALDDAAVLDVQAGNDADLEHLAQAAARALRISASAAAGSSRPS